MTYSNTSLLGIKRYVKSALTTNRLLQLSSALNGPLRVRYDGFQYPNTKEHRTMYKLKTLCIALIAIMSSCGEKKDAETTAAETKTADSGILITAEQFSNSKMVLGKLVEKPFPVTIQTNGMIDVPPENRAVVSAIMGGYIKQTPLLIGNSVKKGQVLVTIENPEFVTIQQNYMEVKQQLTYLQAEYERHQTLREENITSQKNYLKAESEFKTTRARYMGLKKQLTMLNISPSKVEQGNVSSVVSIHAPISGSITQINITKGTYVSPASPILEIIDNDHIHLELSVFEKDIMKIKKGQSIQFRIPEASKDTFEAEVYLIGSSIGENRTIKVHAHLIDEGKTFLTGMFVDARIITDNTMAKAIATEAIVEQEGTFYVLRTSKTTDAGYTFETVEIQPGNAVDGFTEIKNAAQLSDSDTFLTKGAFDVLRE